MSSDQSLQIADLLDPADGHSVAIRLGGETRTWQEVESNSRRLAQAVRSEGLEIGQSWAVLSHNCVEWAEWIVGNARAGTRLVPLNWHLTATELAALLTDSGARILLVGPGLEEVGAKAAELAGGVRIITMAGHYRAVAFFRQRRLTARMPGRQRDVFHRRHNRTLQRRFALGHETNGESVSDHVGRMG